MMEKSTLFVVLFALTCLLQPTINGQSGEKKLVISGQVYNNKGESLAGVLVRAYRGTTNLLDRYETGTDGKYSLTFDKGGPVTRILYEHSAHNPEEVILVSGQVNSVINKVMADAGQQLSTSDKRRLASTLEAIYSIDQAGGVSTAEFKTKYGEIIEKAALPGEMLAWLPVTPRELQNPMTGKWNGSMEFKRQASIGHTFTSDIVPFGLLKLKVVGNVITGEADYGGDAFPKIPITDGTINGKKISFYLHTLDGVVLLTGKMKSDRIRGEAKNLDTKESGKWIVRRVQ